MTQTIIHSHNKMLHVSVASDFVKLLYVDDFIANVSCIKAPWRYIDSLIVFYFNKCILVLQDFLNDFKKEAVYNSL